MKKNIVYSLLVALLLLPLSGCQNDSSRTPDEPQRDARTLTVQLNPTPELKAIIKDLNSRKVLLDWEVGFFDINVAIRQGDVIELIPAVKITEVDGSTCTFDVELPETIDLNQKFDMYGVVAEDLKVENGQLLVNVGGRVMYELTASSNNKDGYIPLYFEQKDVEVYGQLVFATFEHLGSLAVITLFNKSTDPLSTAGLAVRPADGTSEFYHKAALPFVGNEELPYLDLLNPSAPVVNKMTHVTYPSVIIAPNDVRSLGFWFMPNTTSTPEVKLAMYNVSTRKEVLSSNSRPARPETMQKGRAYHLYAEWDGTQLTLVDKEPEKPLPANQPVMKFTTSLVKGERLMMTIGGTNPESERDIWIDLNNNGKRDKGEYIMEFFDKTLSNNLRPFVIDSQEFAIYGEVSTLVLDNGNLTAVDVTKNPHLTQFFAFDGNVAEIDLSQQHSLRRVALEGNQLTKVTFSPQAKTLEEIYLGYNQLTTLDLSMATEALLIELGHNQLTAITVPKFTDIWGLNVEHNQLEAAALNTLFDSVNKAGFNRYYDWQYVMNIWDNPGVATCDLTKLTKKGWEAVTQDPEAGGANNVAQPVPASHRLLKVPLKR